MKILYLLVFTAFANSLFSQNNFTSSNCPIPDNFLLGEYQVSDVVTNDPNLSVFDNETVTITGSDNTRSFVANIFPSISSADDQIISLNLNCGIIQIDEVITNLLCGSTAIALGITSQSDSSTYDLTNGDASFVVNYIEDAFNACDDAHISSFNLSKVCSKPQGVFFNNSTSSTIDINWLELNENNATYEVEYGLEGFTPGSGNTISGISGNSTTVPNLQANVAYEFYIKAICSPSIETNQAGPFTFINIENSDFFRDPANNTCKCPNANFGDSGSIEIDGELKTFTKRTELELRNLIDNDVNDSEIALTCTSEISNMDALFLQEENFNLEISSWDVSNVTSMAEMFSGAENFNLDINNWDVANVNNMSSMFENADDFNKNINNWDVSNVSSMESMFENADSFDQPLVNWDVSNVFNMIAMFAGSDSFNQDLSGWNFQQNVFLSNFLNNSALSTTNYDLLLQSFDNQNIIDITLGANSVGYCDAQTRENLIINKGWEITGDILAQCGAPSTSSTTPFVTTWDISSFSFKNVTINTFDFYDYNYSIDWGDGQVDQNITGSISHEYQNLGTYTISILGTFPYFRLCSDSFSCDNSEKLVSVDAWGDQEWKNMSRSFAESENLTINASDSPDLSNVTDMSGMFIDSGVDQDINSWNVSNVTNMADMFNTATGFNQPLNNWDVSNVTNMSGMFSQAFSFNQSLDMWNVQNVNSMREMFRSALSFNQDINSWDVSSVINMNALLLSAELFNQPLNNWDTSNVIEMNNMFTDALSFNQPLSNWNTANVIFMNSMFKNATAFNQDISGWNFNVDVELGDFIALTNMSANNYDALLQTFDAQNLTDKTLISTAIAYCDDQTRDNLINQNNWAILEDLKGQCGETFIPSTEPFVTTWTIDAFEAVTILTFDYYNYNFDIDWGDGQSDQNVTNSISHTYSTPGTYTVSILGIFPYFRLCDIGQPDANCLNQTRISSIESWGDQQWRYMNSSFRFALFLDLNAADIPDLSNVTDMSKMFSNAENMNTNVDDWDVSNVTNMSELFRGTVNFNQPLDNWNVSNVTDMSFMFSSSGFNQNINNWNVSNVTNMDQMFAFNSFNQPLNNWDVSNVENMFGMFASNDSFDQPLDNWNTSNVKNMAGMFG